MNLEMRLSVEDSPNSAGVAIDMIRCAKIAKDCGLAGPVHPAAAYFCKHPPVQRTDDAAGPASASEGVAPRDGFEPSTNRLTAGCSTAELPGSSLSGEARL